MHPLPVLVAQRAVRAGGRQKCGRLEHTCSRAHTHGYVRVCVCGRREFEAIKKASVLEGEIYKAFVHELIVFGAREVLITTIAPTIAAANSGSIVMFQVV